MKLPATHRTILTDLEKEHYREALGAIMRYYSDMALEDQRRANRTITYLKEKLAERRVVVW